MNNWFIMTICVLLFSSCKDSKEKSYREGIIGKWMVVASELNNKPSKSMDQAFFTFGIKNSVKSNVLDGGEITYSIKNELVTINSPQPLKLEITHFEKDSMIMEGNYDMYYIKFFMKRDTLTSSEAQ